jgi:hypothetical protein
MDEVLVEAVDEAIGTSITLAGMMPSHPPGIDARRIHSGEF